MELAASFLARVLQDIPQPVWVVSRDGTVVFANPAAVETLGYDDASDLIGKPSHQTVHGVRPNGEPYPVEECPMLAPRLEGTRAEGHVADGRPEYFIRKDGTFFPIAWWSAPIDLPTGRGAVLAFTDITEVRRMQADLRERRVAEARAAEARAAQRRMLDKEAAVRRSIARNLHDGAQQRLVSLLLELRMAAAEVPADLPDLIASLERAADEARSAVDELREIAAGVHPVLLARRGLVAAVDGLAERSPLPIQVRSDGCIPRLDSAVELCAYYITAEAITNAIKHAGASTITVNINILPDPTRLSVEIMDDGAGGISAARQGTGLLGMLDRASALDGTVDFREREGFAGSCVALILPLDRSAQATE